MTGAFVLGEVMAYWFCKTVEYGGGHGTLALWLSVLVCSVLGFGITAGKTGVTSIFCRVNVEKWKRPLLFLLLFFLCGWLRMGAEERRTPLEQQLQGHGVLQGVQAEGVVLDWAEKENLYTVTLGEVLVRTKEEEYRQKRLLLSFSSSEVPSCRVGMRCQAVGRLELFSQASNPGEFDYRLYYRAKKLRFRLKASRMTFTEGSPAPLLWHREAFRSFAAAALKTICCPRDRGIFQAVLLGDSSQLDAETRELFQDGGIAHVLAVSGLHVSLIGVSLFTFLRKCGLGYGGAGLLSSLLLCFYGSVTGFGPSVFRAIFMILCFFLASFRGRTYDLLSAMSLSLLLLAMDSPCLLFTAGLQLSYGAVLAIGIVGEKKTASEAESSLQALQVSLAIQLVTLQLILYHFFQFPLWGIFLNLLALPLMGYAAGSGILAVAAVGGGQLLHSLGAVPFLRQAEGLFLLLSQGAVGPGHYIFALYRLLCHVFLKLPFAVLTPGRPWLFVLPVYYLLLFFAAFRLDRRGARGKWRRAVVLVAAVLILCMHPSPGLEVWFLDVGQGDGVLIETREVTILSDCGSSQRRKIGEQVLGPFLESRGIKRIDYLFVSHGDQDHMNGILWLLEEEQSVSVSCLVLPFAAKRGEGYEKLLEAADRRKMQVWYMKAGERLEKGKLKITCCHPPKKQEGREVHNEDRNSHSLVLRAVYGRFSMLLTGDVGQEEEQTMLEDGKTKLEPVTILKAAHHGSGGSSGEAFLDQIRPIHTILSYGEGNSYGHPAKLVVERLRERGSILWRTAWSGAVAVKTDGTRIKIEGFLPKPVDSEEENGL